jgi:[acyl-carrier-protein] S-malonyltransferase
MSKIAFTFPGQGSQSVGMGIQLFEQYPQVAPLFEQAQEVLGWDLLQVCKEGPDDRLRQTDVAQPALYVTGYATFVALGSLGIRPDAVAGHSIGEYAALAAAEVFTFKDGLALVRERARLMKDAGQQNPGSMMAILGLTPDQAKEVCAQASAKGVCAAVNFNSPEQTVIAGQVEALEEAGKIAPAHGAKRVVPLNVAGAFHSPLMADAAKGMKEVLGKMVFRNAVIPVAMNVDGQLHQPAEEIRTQLSQQLDHAVQWVQTITNLKVAGFTHFVEVGAGRVLTGLLRRIDRQLIGYATDTLEAIKEAGDALAASRKG